MFRIIWTQLSVKTNRGREERREGLGVQDEIRLEVQLKQGVCDN